MAREGLTPKQAAFVREYLIDRNGTQAAIRAGYAPNAANEQAARLLANASVKSELDRLTAKQADKLELTAEMVLRGLLAEATRTDGPVSQGAKVRAWELLGKHLGLLTDKTKVEVEGDLSMFLAASLDRFNRLYGQDTKAIE